MCVSALIFFRGFYEATRNLDSQPPTRTDHVEACHPRGCSFAFTFYRAAPAWSGRAGKFGAFVLAVPLEPNFTIGDVEELPLGVAELALDVAGHVARADRVALVPEILAAGERDLDLGA